jgi:hypothetical protein
MATLFATLRIKRKPTSNDIVCLKLRVAHALPVHTYPLHDEDITDRATMDVVTRTLEELRLRYKCKDVELDVKKDVLKLLERQG